MKRGVTQLVRRATLRAGESAAWAPAQAASSICSAAAAPAAPSLPAVECAALPQPLFGPRGFGLRGFAFAPLRQFHCSSRAASEVTELGYALEDELKHEISSYKPSTACGPPPGCARPPSRCITCPNKISVAPREHFEG